MLELLENLLGWRWIKDLFICSSGTHSDFIFWRNMLFFFLLQDIEVMFEAYGIRVSSEHDTFLHLQVDRICKSIPLWLSKTKPFFFLSCLCWRLWSTGCCRREWRSCCRCSAPPRKPKKAQTHTPPTSSLSTQYVNFYEVWKSSEKILSPFTSSLTDWMKSAQQKIALNSFNTSFNNSFYDLLKWIISKKKKPKQNNTCFLFALSRQSSVKFDLTAQPLSELDTIEDSDLDKQHAETLSAVSNFEIYILSLHLKQVENYQPVAQHYWTCFQKNFKSRGHFL